MSSPFELDGPYFRQRTRAKRAALKLLKLLAIVGLVSAVLGFSAGYFDLLRCFK
jgi:hypothetical protein